MKTTYKEILYAGSLFFGICFGVFLTLDLLRFMFYNYTEIFAMLFYLFLLGISLIIGFILFFERRVRKHKNEPKYKLFELYGNTISVYYFAVIRFWHASFEVIERYVPKSGVILDMGCGYGIFANYLCLTSYQRKVIGKDNSKRKIDYIKSNPIMRPGFYVGDALEFYGFKDLDAVVCLDLLHHMNSFEDHLLFIRQARLALKTGGTLLIKEIDVNPWWKFQLTKCIDSALYWGDRFWFRESKGFTRMLQEFGFTVEFFPLHKGKLLSHVMYVCKKI